MLRLVKHFKEPNSSVPQNFENETGLMSKNSEPVDTFAFNSQIIGIKNHVDDVLYRMDLSYGQFKSKMEDSIDKFSTYMESFEEKLSIKRSDNPLEVNEEWHAELTEDALSSVEKM